MRTVCRFFIALLWLLALPSSLLALEKGLDVNDVAILFPIDGSHKPVPYMTLADEGLITARLFKEVIARATELSIAAPSTASIINAGDWNIVALRYDPCAPIDHGLASIACVPELRLIAQPTAFFSPADSAMHLLYRFDETALKADNAILQALYRLKLDSEKLMGITNAGQPLGVHPVLSAALKNNRQDVSKLFLNFVKTYARSAMLHQITMVGLRNGTPTNWIFFGGDVSANHWRSNQVPNLNKSSISDHVELDVGKEFDSFRDSPIDPSLSVAAFFNSTTDDVSKQIAPIGESLHRIDNPAFGDRNTIDCVSCHASTSIRLSVDFAFPEHLKGITASISKGITAFPAVQTLANHPLHWNLRAFGYFGLAPTVTLRTVYEAAEAVEKVNKVLGLTAPGPDCSVASVAVMKCFVDTSILGSEIKSNEDCLALCQPLKAPDLPLSTNAR